MSERGRRQHASQDAAHCQQQTETPFVGHMRNLGVINGNDQRCSVVQQRNQDNEPRRQRPIPNHQCAEEKHQKVNGGCDTIDGIRTHTLDHFLLFLFFAIVIWNFFIPPKLIVLIAILNDAAVLVISVDNAQISAKPDKWRMGQMMTLSVVLGLFLTMASYVHFFIGKYAFDLSDDVLATIMYLQMSSCPHFVIFSTRLSGHFWENPPSLVFASAVLLTQIFAMFISIYGVLSEPCGWGWGASVMAVSLTYFMLLDFIKVAFYRKWNFALTVKLWPTKARKERLKIKRAKQAIDLRVAETVHKVRKVCHMVAFARKLRHYHPLPEPKMALPVTKGH